MVNEERRTEKENRENGEGERRLINFVFIFSLAKYELLNESKITHHGLSQILMGYTYVFRRYIE